MVYYADVLWGLISLKTVLKVQHLQNMKFPSEIHMHVSFPSLQINFLFLSMDVIILKLYISQGGILSNGSVSWKHASKTLSTTS